ncbi:MAG TPA: hypothetical protein DIC22_07650 [Chitinophagaceae bacterium]|nr:hypothetical protein [Chitinophagaceae bacterium]
MKIFLRIFFPLNFYALSYSCKKDNTEPSHVTPTPPPPPAKILTISNLTYSPGTVPLSLCSARLTVSGTIDFSNATGGVHSLRLNAPNVLDITILVQGNANQVQGILNGFFLFWYARIAGRLII